MANEKISNRISKQIVLNEKINNFLWKEESFNGALAGIEVVNATSGKTILKRMNDVRLRPASNMKLFTSTGALAVLGKDYTFETDIWVNGKVHNGVLNGDLYLKGKGDPTLLVSDLNMFAQTISSFGINKIDGNIIGDDTWYDSVRLSPDMIWSDESYYYGSQISALTVSPNSNFDTGTISVKIIPTEVGKEPLINIYPKTNYVEIINHAVTSLNGSDGDLIIYRERTNNKIVIVGYAPLSIGSIQEWVSVWEPTNYTMTLFCAALKQEGISWTGEMEIGKVTHNARLVYRHYSNSLASMLIPFMKLSNNGHGEVLIKEMGKVERGIGSWEAGLAVLNDCLEKLEINTDTLVLRDGSGISLATLVPAKEFAKLLFVIQDQTWFPEFINSLPIAGEAERMLGGTLRERLAGYDVKAKTGTINSVSTLSGYLKTKESSDVIFSILLNNLLNEEDGPRIIDQIMKIIFNDA